MFSCLWRIQEFFREGAPNFDIPLSVPVGFPGRIILKHIENEKGSRGMLPRKIFENLHTVEAILVLFEQFLGKFCINFLLLHLNVLPNMISCILFMHFVHTFSIMRA